MNDAMYLGALIGALAYVLCCIASRVERQPTTECKLCMRPVPEGWARCDYCTMLLNRRTR